MSQTKDDVRPLLPVWSFLKILTVEGVFAESSVFGGLKSGLCVDQRLKHTKKKSYACKNVWTKLQTEEEKEVQVEPIRAIKAEGNAEKEQENNMEDLTLRDGNYKIKQGMTKYK